MKKLGELSWMILGGGIVTAFGYILGGLFLCLTIIGIPYGFHCIQLSIVALFPFDVELRKRDSTENSLQKVMSILWIAVPGIGNAIFNYFWASLCYITIIGKPYSKQQLKLASLSLKPFEIEIH